MITKDPFLLLKKSPAFSLLGDKILKRLTQEMLMEYYPRGQTILHQNGPAPEHLTIVRSGAVKVFVRTNEGEEILVDYRSTGEFFGLLSFVCGDIARDTIVAAEDTTCYLLNQETVLGL